MRRDRRWKSGTNEEEGEKEHEGQNQQQPEEERHPASLARGRRRRHPALTGDSHHEDYGHQEDERQGQHDVGLPLAAR